jgi:LytS/YehU family sensor histidine kinase
MKVENTINGMHEENTGGIGLGNVKRRLELLYPDKYELKIVRQDGLYSTSLKLER